MKIWVYIDGRQQGPFEMDELRRMEGFDKNTKVWFEGLPKWYPAGSLEQLSTLFDAMTDTEAAELQAEAAEGCDMATDDEEGMAVAAAESEGVNAERHDAAPAAEPRMRFTPGANYMAAQRPSEPCPATYLGLSIFLLICCCSPISVAALVASICVSSFYSRGDLEKARKASEVAAWLVMVAIALGFLPVMFMSALFG